MEPPPHPPAGDPKSYLTSINSGTGKSLEPLSTPARPPMWSQPGSLAPVPVWKLDGILHGNTEPPSRTGVKLKRKSAVKTELVTKPTTLVGDLSSLVFPGAWASKPWVKIPLGKG